MNARQLMTINAVLAIAAGIAFTIYAPLALAFFGIPEIPSDNVLLYWNTASFARLFGAALFGFGLLLWSIRGLIVSQETGASPARGILSALLFANGIGAFVAIVQQSSVWKGLAGWVMFAIFLLFVAGYGYLLGRRSG